MNKTQQILKEREDLWSKEFEAVFEGTKLNIFKDQDDFAQVKSFHATTISLLLTSLKEEVEKLTTTGVYKVDHQREIRVQKPEYTGGYNDAVSDISTFISETISNIQTK